MARGRGSTLAAEGVRATSATLRAMQVVALVLGAGRGERFRASGGDSAVPKALVPLAGKSLLERSIRAMARAPEVDAVLPVLSQEGLASWPTVAAQCADCVGLLDPVVGGRERTDSVRNGIADLPEDVRWVAVHDAARPMVSAADVSRVIAAAKEEGAALLACPVTDTIHRADAAGNVAETPVRKDLWAALTPQVFRRDWLEDALAGAAAAAGGPATDDADLVARLGHTVVLVAGDPANLKITTAADLRAAEARLVSVREDA